MKIKLFTIPNMLTLANLLCGGLAILSLNEFIGNNKESLEFINYQGSYLVIILFLILASLFFDLLDGMVARALKINSEIGVQLDSLADMVSFGLTPGFLMYIMLTNNSENFGGGYIGFIGFFITLFSALRLAKFNVDTEQSTYFKGLATPANTILIFSLFWIYVRNGFIIDPNIDLYLLLGVSLISCILLIADIPLFAFKFKGFAWKDNHYKYVFLLASIVLIFFFQMMALPFIILLYIFISIIFRKKIVHA
jgi:CDP-diacylglycerol--serine O-phosphatidyltransferase